MGVEFRSVTTGETLCMSWELWNTLFFIAQDYGWTPSGTIHDAINWNGSYHRNDGQMVAAEDAAALARALHSVLIVVEWARTHGSDPIVMSEDGTPVEGTEALLDVLWAMRGLPPHRATRRYILQRRAGVIRQLIAFLEQGAFCIF